MHASLHVLPFVRLYVLRGLEKCKIENGSNLFSSGRGENNF